MKLTAGHKKVSKYWGAELVHLREELSVANASLAKTENEKKYLIW
jgi:hypothetical protein